MTHLLLIAIGPVQPFIAAARKIRDLAVGSWLLSELSKAAARSLAAQGGTLIFPPAGADLAAGSEVSVANKILADVPGDPAVAAAAAREALLAARESVFEEAWQRLQGKATPADTAELAKMRALFERQRDATGEFYAVWTPCAGAAAYAGARRQVEKLLAARKSARMFQAPAWDGAGLRKSSLDGVWETIFPEQAKDSPLRRRLENHLLIKKGEHLDALALVKRLPPRAREQWKFDGLPEVAIETWLARRQSDEAFRKRIAAYTELCGQWKPTPFFPAVLEDWIKDETEDARGLPPGEKDKLRAEHERLRSSNRSLCRDFGQPDPYACILCGDGDHMGRALDDIRDREGHQTFSSELSRFAAEARRIVEAHAGELIYSGGDDVLAFLPLHTAAQCAEALRTSFAAIMSSACPADVEHRPTFSAGIAVVHMKTPLDQSLSLARRAESFAKNRFGRDALCWLWNTRGNTEMTTGGKWDAPWRTRLHNAAELYRQRQLSRRTGYQIRQAARPLGDGPLAWNEGAPADALTSEVVRILKHKDTSGASSGDLADRLKLREPGETLTPRAFADVLVLAGRLARAADMAAGKAPAEPSLED